MSRYSPEEEERIRMQARVQAWARAGLLHAGQASAIDDALRTSVRRTNVFLRGVLALFTAVVVAASIALAFVAFDISHDPANAIALAIAAAGCLALADALVSKFRLYRHGVEEALAAAAAVLVAMAVDLEAHAVSVPRYHVITLLVGSAAAFGVYRRFGLVYAAIAAVICAAVTPFGFDGGEPARRLIGALIFATVFASVRALHRRHGDDYPGDDYAMIQAAAGAGIYGMLNVHLFDFLNASSRFPTAAWFYWLSYLATWLLPAAGLTLAIRDRDRSLLTIALTAALATLYTNKPYLGWARQTWDPILLGVLLVAVATAVRRWLASGPNGERHGFTAARILESDRDLLSAIATASAAWPRNEHHAPATAEPSPSPFEGGRSGGAGGGASY